MINISDFLMIKEAALLLGVHKETLRNWTKEGKFPSHRNPMNNYFLYKRSDVEEFLQKIDDSKNM